MKTTSKITAIKITAMTATLAAGVSFAFLPAVHADTLTFNNTSASTAAAQMSKRFGVTIVFKGSANSSLPVTFSVDDPDTPGGRLQAISSLASALDLDFQKVYVVSRVDKGAAVPEVPLDSNGPIVFTSTQVPVRDAIQTVASVDNALTEINESITGDVSLPSTRMTASAAAAAIAKQTGTEWKAYYGLFKRGETPARFGGEVVGQTSSGQPITVLPFLSFRSAASHAVPLTDGSNAVVGPTPPPSAFPDVTSVANTNFGFAEDAGYGGFGFGDPYGYANPYGAYGYGGPTTAVVTPGAGVGTTPVTTGPVTTAPTGTAGTTAILPGFPYVGTVGGQAPVGSY